MPKNLSVSVTSTSKYPISFTDDPFVELRKYLTKGIHVAVITDSNLQRFYGKYIAELRSECSLEIFSFPAGEKQKNIRTVQQIIRELQEYNFERKNTLIVALGGGVVGDITGFVASMYLRGVPYIQIPTSLLSMVDSSIGGKTGVNTRYGKNMIGAFYHPQAVIISPLFLKKLPEAEIQNGLAEMIKHSVLDSKRHCNQLKKSIPKILKKMPRVSMDMVRKSIMVKKKIVEQDEKESSGVRSFLNFGHTIGHAIEKASGHSVSHGNAIAIGMALESKIAEQKHGFKHTEALLEVLEAAGLPTTLPKNMRWKELLKFMKQDKKNEDGKIAFALPKDFGEMLLEQYGENQVNIMG